MASAKLHGATFAPEAPRVLESFAEVLDERPSFSVIALNAPIGYVDEVRRAEEHVTAWRVPSWAGVVRRSTTPQPNEVSNGQAVVKDDGLDAITNVLRRYRYAAFEEFIARVDPKELEERFERATKRGVFGQQNKSKYWELYAEMFAGLTQRPAEGFPVYTEAFAKAYETKLRASMPARRSPFAGDPSDSAGAPLAAGDKS